MNKFTFKFWTHHEDCYPRLNQCVQTTCKQEIEADTYEEALEVLKKQEPILYIHSYTCVFGKARVALRH